MRGLKGKIAAVTGGGIDAALITARAIGVSGGLAANV